MAATRTDFWLVQFEQKLLMVLNGSIVASEHPVEGAWADVARRPRMDDEGQVVVVDGSRDARSQKRTHDQVWLDHVGGRDHDIVAEGILDRDIVRLVQCQVQTLRERVVSSTEEEDLHGGRRFLRRGQWRREDGGEEGVVEEPIEHVECNAVKGGRPDIKFVFAQGPNKTGDVRGRREKKVGGATVILMSSHVRHTLHCL